MKGSWQPADASDDSKGGVYVDARGVTWTVTTKPVGSGLIQQLQWTAQSQSEDDAGKYLYQTGWTKRVLSDLLTSVDAFAGSRVSAPAGTLVVAGLVLLLLLTDKRGR